MDAGIEAVVVLAGGEGRRLGTPKAWIEIEGAPLLTRVLDRLAPLAPDRLVVARPDQPLPPGTYRRVDDALPGAGPLAGLAAGLAALDDAARVAVSACDYPFTDPTLFRALAAIEPEADVVVPREVGHLHPLQAVWRVSAGAVCAALLHAGERRVRPALERLRIRVVEGAALTGVDAGRALLNVNVPDDLARARSLVRGDRT